MSKKELDEEKNDEEQIREFYEDEFATVGYNIANSERQVRYPRLNFKLLDDAINQVERELPYNPSKRTSFLTRTRIASSRTPTSCRSSFCKSTRSRPGRVSAWLSWASRRRTALRSHSSSSTTRTRNPWRTSSATWSTWLINTRGSWKSLWNISILF